MGRPGDARGLRKRARPQRPGGAYEHKAPRPKKKRKAARVLGGEPKVQLQLLLAGYAEPESDTTGEESGGTAEEEGGCAHSSAYITRSRCEQPVPFKLVSGDSGAGSGSGSECDGCEPLIEGGCEPVA